MTQSVIEKKEEEEEKSKGIGNVFVVGELNILWSSYKLGWKESVHFMHMHTFVWWISVPGKNEQHLDVDNVSFLFP